MPPWLGPNLEGFIFLLIQFQKHLKFIFLPRRPLPIHAGPRWKWRYFACNFTLRCVLGPDMFHPSLGLSFHAFLMSGSQPGVPGSQTSSASQAQRSMNIYWTEISKLLTGKYSVKMFSTPALVPGLHMLSSVTRVTESGDWSHILTYLFTSGHPHKSLYVDLAIKTVSLNVLLTTTVTVLWYY